MAQSQVSAPSLGEPGGGFPWESTGAVGEQPLDVWSRFRDTPVVQPPAAVGQKPDRTQITHVLTAWRAAERRLEDLVEASPMRFEVLSEIARLRAEYQRLFAQAIR